MGLRPTKRPDNLMILPRILAETGRITDHGGRPGSCRTDGAGGETRPRRHDDRARLEVDCQWQVRATVTWRSGPDVGSNHRR